MDELALRLRALELAQSFESGTGPVIERAHRYLKFLLGDPSGTSEELGPEADKPAPQLSEAA